ncbi:MAG: tetratricopeptide repeat protein, partial [Elusimicrobiota bacterium]|nr:tetratricopeptide repeat protein [Elusimicrobiota bacterium]
MKIKTVIKIILLALAVICLILVIFQTGKISRLNNSGVSLYNKGNFAESAKTFDKAESEAAKNKDIANNSASADYKNGDLQKAESKFLSVANSPLVSKETEFNSLYALGNISSKNNDLDKAADYYKRALKINPDDADAIYNLETILKKKDEQENQNNNNQQNQNNQQKDNQDNKQNQQNNNNQNSQQQKEKEQDRKRQEDLKNQMDENNRKQQENEAQRKEAQQKQQEAKNQG